MEGVVRMVATHGSTKLGSVKEALSDSNASEWMDAMKDKMESMWTNHV